jgi:hypothetical protein
MSLRIFNMECQITLEVMWCSPRMPHDLGFPRHKLGADVLWRGFYTTNGSHLTFSILFSSVASCFPACCWKQSKQRGWWIKKSRAMSTKNLSIGPIKVQSIEFDCGSVVHVSQFDNFLSHRHFVHPLLEIACPLLEWLSKYHSKIPYVASSVNGRAIHPCSVT